MKKRFLYVVLSCILLAGNAMPVSAAMNVGQYKGDDNDELVESESNVDESNAETAGIDDIALEEKSSDVPQSEAQGHDELNGVDLSIEDTPEDGSEDAEEQASDMEMETFAANSFEREGTKIIKYTGTGGDVVIPDWCTEIDSLAFSLEQGITSVTIPGSVKKIGKFAFSECFGINKITLGNGIETIDESAFNNCTGLQEVIIPDSVVTIGAFAFNNCKKMTCLKIGSGVKKIGGSAFKNTAITSLVVPDSVTEIGASAFWLCRSLETVILGENLSAISDSMFNNCSALTTISFGNKVLSIGVYAFSSCSSLTSISLPSSVKALDTGAFAGCAGLKSFDFGDGIHIIDDYAFKNTAITELKLPGSVRTIGTGAFSNCKNLQRLYMSYAAQNIGDDIINGTNDVTVYVYDNTYGQKWAQEKGIKHELLGMFKPLPVTNLGAVSNGKNRVKLTWQVSANSDGYLIYAQKNGKYAYCGMTGSNSFTDVKALDSDYNFYWVFPYVKDSAGKMYPGGCTKYVFAKGTTAAVTDLKAAGQTGGVKLTWTKSASAEGYLIYGKTATGAYGYKGMTTQGTTFTDKKAPKSEYSFYWVYPYHKDRNGKMIVGGTPKYVFGKAK